MYLQTSTMREDLKQQLAATNAHDEQTNVA